MERESIIYMIPNRTLRLWVKVGLQVYAIAASFAVPLMVAWYLTPAGYGSIEFEALALAEKVMVGALFLVGIASLLWLASLPDPD